jgi:DNA-binding CsgD family transcriptional regulator
MQRAEAELEPDPGAASADCAAVYGWLVRHGRVALSHPDRFTGLDLPEERILAAIEQLCALRLAEAGSQTQSLSQSVSPSRPDAAPNPVSDPASGPASAAGPGAGTGREPGDEISILTGELVANPPDLAAALLVGDREADLRAQAGSAREELNRLTALRTAIDGFTTPYQQARAYREETGVIEVLDDFDNVNALLETASTECRREVMACQPGGVRPQSVLAKALPRDLALLSRGIRLRSIYQHTAQYDGPTCSYAATATSAGSQIRIAAELPPRMIIIDREVVFLAHQGRALGAVVIREPSIVTALCAVFEMAWNLAAPFGLAADAGGLTTIDRHILNLLVDGMTDKAIGARLAMSDRSVREHVAKLYRLLGATSRFQAGFRAGALGLVERPVKRG